MAILACRSAYRRLAVDAFLLPQLYWQKPYAARFCCYFPLVENPTIPSVSPVSFGFSYAWLNNDPYRHQRQLLTLIARNLNTNCCCRQIEELTRAECTCVVW